MPIDCRLRHRKLLLDMSCVSIFNYIFIIISIIIIIYLHQAKPIETIK